jgi:hypothetical protein
MARVFRKHQLRIQKFVEARTHHKATKLYRFTVIAPLLEHVKLLAILNTCPAV